MGNLQAMWNYKHGSGYNFYRGYTFPSGGNRLLDIQSGGGSVLSTFAYDAAGNRTQAGTTRFYEWNAGDQLRFFKVQNGTTPTLYAQYRYEGSGQRLQKLATDQQGNTTLTVYIGGMFEYQKLVKSGTAYERTYTHLMDDQARIATLRHGSAEDDLTESAYYVLADHLGSVSVRLTADSTGALIDREEFYPYGETSFRTSGKKRYRFTGKEKDAESGLYYYGARYYAPWTATFLSPDPVANSYQGSYVYADANPIVMNDPTGGQSEGSGNTPSGDGGDGGSGDGGGSNNPNEGPIIEGKTFDEVVVEAKFEPKTNQVDNTYVEKPPFLKHANGLDASTGLGSNAAGQSSLLDDAGAFFLKADQFIYGMQGPENSPSVLVGELMESAWEGFKGSYFQLQNLSTYDQGTPLPSTVELIANGTNEISNTLERIDQALYSWEGLDGIFTLGASGSLRWSGSLGHTKVECGA